MFVYICYSIISFVIYTLLYILIMLDTNDIIDFGIILICSFLWPLYIIYVYIGYKYHISNKFIDIWLDSI